MEKQQELKFVYVSKQFARSIITWTATFPD